MPLSLHQQIAPEGEIGLWHITEPEEWFLADLALAPAELEQLQPLRGRRRVEWLAARQLVHQMSGREERLSFFKDEFGKPKLLGSAYQISISHSHGMAAAIAAPHRVGIDLQYLVPKIERLAKRFLSPAELARLSDGPERIPQLHVYWCAKEALYKAYGRRALDFCEHIQVQPFAFNEAGGQAEGLVQKGAVSLRFELKYWPYGAYMLVYAVEVTS